MHPFVMRARTYDTLDPVQVAAAYAAGWADMADEEGIEHARARAVCALANDRLYSEQRQAAAAFLVQLDDEAAAAE